VQHGDRRSAAGGGGRYGAQVSVASTNLLSGRTAQGQPVGDEFSRVLLAPPLAVWISQSSVINAWFVQAFNGHTGKTTLLDSTCPGAGQYPVQAARPSPFGNLQLLRCVTGCTPIGSTSAWWTRNGAWQSALVPVSWVRRVGVCGVVAVLLGAVAPPASAARVAGVDIDTMTKRGSGTSRTTPTPRQGGPLFNRRRWSSIQSAPTMDGSGPVGGCCGVRLRQSR
jgi:hypothetical protein